MIRGLYQCRGFNDDFYEATMQVVGSTPVNFTRA